LICINRWWVRNHVLILWTISAVSTPHSKLHSVLTLDDFSILPNSSTATSGRDLKSRHLSPGG
jgi:hypothetical protein